MKNIDYQVFKEIFKDNIIGISGRFQRFLPTVSEGMTDMFTGNEMASGRF